MQCDVSNVCIIFVMKKIVLETMLLYQGFQPHLLQAAALRGGTTVNGCCIPGGTSVMVSNPFL